MMELDITDEEENPLFDRTTLTLSLDHPGEPTPSEDDVRRRVAAERDVDPRTVRIDTIRSTQGSTRSTGTVTLCPEPVVDELPNEEDADDTADEDAEAEDVSEEADEPDQEADEEEADADDETDDADDTEDES